MVHSGHKLVILVLNGNQNRVSKMFIKQVQVHWVVKLYQCTLPCQVLGIRDDQCIHEIKTVEILCRKVLELS
jgi:peroxiredoxin family protein